MQITHYVGIDVSKDTLDYSVCYQGQIINRGQVFNSLKGAGRLLSNLRKIEGLALSATVFCMEFTGVYNNILLEKLVAAKCKICLEPAMRIKKSQGMARGKNDKVDADRIADYAYTYREKLRLYIPEKEELKKLKQLIAMRERLVDTRVRLKVPIKENKAFLDKALAKMEERAFKASIKAIEADLEAIEQMIEEHIDSHSEIRQQVDLLTSIDGIGKVTAVNLIVVTGGFKNFSSPSEFACYAGVAPFEHSSGSSIRGKTRVSHMANKKVKKNLHMAAMAAITCKGELRQYYERKVSEGKNKMSVLNAVRNKLIHRAFAVIKRQTPYQKNYQQLLG